MREALANGEPEDSRCAGCTIGRPDFPEIDDLSRSVLAFGAVWDHPAHEGYRDELSPLLGPFLRVSDAFRWLARRQAAWDEAEAIHREEIEKKTPKPPAEVS